MRVVFMGTPEFSVDSLNALVEANHEIVAVYTRKPSPAGRGKKERKSQVHERADALGIEVATPTTLKDASVQQQFKDFKPDVAVVVAYGLLLPKAVLDCCSCYNIHASLLPRWRGAAPIQRAIEAGDTETGVTIMRMDEGMDTGDMVLKDSCSLIPTPNAGQLHDILKIMGARLIVEALKRHASGNIVLESQDNTLATHAKKLIRDEERIDWNQSSQTIYRHIQAFNPYPSVYFTFNDQKIKIYEAHIITDIDSSAYKAGTVMDNQLTIATEDGAIRPTLLQRQGKNKVGVDDFLRGFPIHKDSQLG